MYPTSGEMYVICIYLDEALRRLDSGRSGLGFPVNIGVHPQLGEFGLLPHVLGGLLDVGRLLRS